MVLKGQLYTWSFFPATCKDERAKMKETIRAQQNLINALKTAAGSRELGAAPVGSTGPAQDTCRIS